MVAYLVSSVGALLGLLLIARARDSTGRARAAWLVGGSLSTGWTGVWVMHFIAMMGFRVSGTRVRYDLPLTSASAAFAIVVVGTGLSLAARGGEGPALAGAGLLTGLGIAGMHYLGMAAMNMNADVSYDPVIVALSVLIAVTAATAALRYVRRTGPAAAVAGALILGVAVSGVHHTGMFAMRVRVRPAGGEPPGAEAIDLLPPVVVAISVVTFALLLAVLLAPGHAVRQAGPEPPVGG
ncbi:MHYT domain-containing protein [Spongiactinospora sp. 9N601]|uniref:MHYT domain-containing protein n=1 Tax=Spongiactinospora sp. 9N601 TaxID=3375149 RepID=UPI0037B793BA